jgi:hypothetical protein
VGVAVRAILARISPGSVSGAEERRIGRRASLEVIFGGVRADQVVANISRDGATSDGDPLIADSSRISATAVNATRSTARQGLDRS